MLDELSRMEKELYKKDHAEQEYRDLVEKIQYTVEKSKQHNIPLRLEHIQQAFGL